jgi:hypothetical protein
VEAGLDPGDKVRDYLDSFDTGSLMVTYDPANFLLNGTTRWPAWPPGREGFLRPRPGRPDGDRRRGGS